MAKIQRETSRGFSVGEYSASTLTNSSSETTLFSQNIVAGRMGTNKELVFGLLPPSITVKIKFGSATLTVLNGQSLATSLASAKPFIIEGMVCNNSVSTQFIYAKISQASNTLPLLLSASSGMDSADWTIDTSSDQTFSITAQFATANNAATLTFKHASVELS